MSLASHHAIRESLLERIQSGEWALGARIPGEIDLASEYGCARTTINRALRTLAEEGLLVRKRKGGTRIRQMPVRQAKFEIPIVREQVEALGSTYSHQLVKRTLRVPPSSICERLGLPAGVKALYLETIHYADERPYSFEERWVNAQAVPAILEAPFDTVSVNEWLVKTVPFSSGEVVFSAICADAKIANAIAVKKGAAVFLVDRTTWFKDEFITTLKLYYSEGYRMRSRL